MPSAVPTGEKIQMKNKTATIGFWLVLGANKKYPLLVCPALVKNEAVDTIDILSIKDVWSVAVQAPVDTSPDAIMVMIPEVITVTNLSQKVEKIESLWEIQAVKEKCESLSNKYVNHVRTVSQN